MSDRIIGDCIAKYPVDTVIQPSGYILTYGAMVIRLLNGDIRIIIRSMPPDRSVCEIKVSKDSSIPDWERKIMEHCKSRVKMGWGTKFYSDLMNLFDSDVFELSYR